MRQQLYPTVLFLLCLASAGAAHAERQPTLDEALAGVLQDDVGPAPARGPGRLCRTLTDLGRRGRKATVCMAQADWDVLVRAAKPASRRPAAIRVSTGYVRPYAR